MASTSSRSRLGRDHVVAEDVRPAGSGWAVGGTPAVSRAATSAACSSTAPSCSVNRSSSSSVRSRRARRATWATSSREISGHSAHRRGRRSRDGRSRRSAARARRGRGRGWRRGSCAPATPARPARTPPSASTSLDTERHHVVVAAGEDQHRAADVGQAGPQGDQAPGSATAGRRPAGGRRPPRGRRGRRCRCPPRAGTRSPAARKPSEHVAERRRRRVDEGLTDGQARAPRGGAAATPAARAPPIDSPTATTGPLRAASRRYAASAAAVQSSQPRPARSSGDVPCPGSMRRLHVEAGRAPGPRASPATDCVEPVRPCRTEPRPGRRRLTDRSAAGAAGHGLELQHVGRHARPPRRRGWWCGPGTPVGGQALEQRLRPACRRSGCRPPATGGPGRRTRPGRLGSSSTTLPHRATWPSTITSGARHRPCSRRASRSGLA